MTSSIVPPDLPAGRPGDPGLFEPGSEVWRVGREKVLLAGGPAALLLQLAHPLVAAGVAAYSDFPRDPLQRLRATLGATLAITFGDSAQARDAAAGVARTHRRVRGTLPAAVGRFAAGTSYRATDPELAMWVYGTLVFTAVETYSRFVSPLSDAQRGAYYREGKAFAALFGVTEDVMPPDFAAFDSYFDRMLAGPDLVVGADAAALAPDILAPELSGPLRPFASLAGPLTAALLPPRLRTEYGLAWGTMDRAAYRAVSGAIRTGIRVLPARLRYWPHYVAALRRVGAAGNEDGQSSVIP